MRRPSTTMTSGDAATCGPLGLIFERYYVAHFGSSAVVLIEIGSPARTLSCGEVGPLGSNVASPE